MTSTGLAMPKALDRGLSRLRSLTSCEVDQVPYFDSSIKQWVVPLWLIVEQPGNLVGKRTKWCVLVEESYPYGCIAFHPSVDGGLSVTFPHQDRNTLVGDHCGWRSGKICLDSPLRGERRVTFVRDPVGDAENRLCWHVERALAWLDAAATGRLLAPNDPFELPSRPLRTQKEHATPRIVHDESLSCFHAWEGLDTSTGSIELGSIPGISNVIVVGAFVDQQDKRIRHWSGRQFTALNDTSSGLWWLWPKPIVVPPWHAPGTWGELRIAGRASDVDVDTTLEQIARSLRGRKDDTILLLGYPIPERIDSKPVEIHWDAVILPHLAPATGRPPNGFRPNARGWWERDRHEVFTDNTTLNYLRTENWSGERLQARGQLPAFIRNAQVAVLGVGALGSMIAELLVRAGLKNIALIDGDLLEAGNICRHITTLTDIGQEKVHAVASRLQQISPFVQTFEHGNGLPVTVDAMVDMLNPFDVIVDCTGSDGALALLARGWWSIPRIFISFSLGFAARRLFSFGVAGHQFPLGEFTRLITPWLDDESLIWANSGEFLEGPGCWSPLFPARYDDVVMAASVCIKELEAITSQRLRKPRFQVFEQKVRSMNNGFHSFAPIQLTYSEE